MRPGFYHVKLYIMRLLILFYVFGTGFVLLSVYLRYWRGKRRFERRNMAGMETFKSYNKALSANFIENIASFLSLLLMVIGILLLLMALFGRQDIMRVNHW